MLATTAAILGGSAIAGGVLGGLASSGGSADAARITRQTTMMAIQAQMEMFNKTMEMYAPFREAGTSVLPEMKAEASLSGTDPLYKWKQQQFEETTNRALAARGLWNSGTGLKAELQGEAGLEAQNTQEVWNRQAQLANIGLSAVTGSAGAAQTTGANIGQNYMSSGALQGQAAIQQGQAMGSMYSGLGNIPGQLYTTQQTGNLMNSMNQYYNLQAGAASTSPGLWQSGTFSGVN